MRIKWIDIARGIGILLVVLGHTRISGTCVFPFIASFHMPLFFLIAGLCFDETRYATYLEYVKRKSVALLYPYLTMSLFVIALFAVFHIDNSTTYSIPCLLSGMVHGNTFGPCWFLPVLLWVELFYCLMARLIDTSLCRLVFCMLCYFVGVGMTRGEFHDYWINVVFLSMSFYGFGHFMSRWIQKKMSTIKITFFSITILLLHILIMYLAFPYTVKYSRGFLGNEYLFFPLAVMGSFIVLASAKLISCYERVANVFSWLGKNSIVIFVFHPACGVCRQSWGGGMIMTICEYGLLVILVWLLSSPLHNLIVPYRKSKG